MSRPRTLRVRLAIIFALTTTVVAAALTVLLLHLTRRQLANAIDEGLVPITTELAARVKTQGPQAVAGPAPELHPPSDAFAQVLSMDGRILATSRYFNDDKPLIRPDRDFRTSGLGKAAHRQLNIGRPGGGSPLIRVMAVKVQAPDQMVVLATATTFDDPLQLERDLERALRYGLPLLASVIALGGWLLTGAMFKPVRSMIEQADSISAGEPGGRLDIVSGGTELRALATRLNAMLDRIEEAASHERAFLDDASHELRTPIAIVRGELEGALTRAADNPELRAALDSVLDEIERLEQLAHNLLVLARTRATKPSIDGAPADLATLVERAVRSISRRAEHRHIQIHQRGEAIVNGDESSLQRAVFNLLDNAVRYAASEVTVTIEAQGSRVIVTIADDGPGFDAAVLPHAFDRFTRDPGRGGGLGLGLAITSAILATHGGHAAAENLPGGGAAVRLQLPAA